MAPAPAHLCCTHSLLYSIQQLTVVRKDQELLIVVEQVLQGDGSARGTGGAMGNGRHGWTMGGGGRQAFTNWCIW